MRIRRIGFNLLFLAAICLAGWLLIRNVGSYSTDEIVESLAQIPFWRLAAAVGFAFASYACLTGFDALGLLYAGKPQPYWRAALTSFVSLSMGHNIGLAALSSGAIRYRFYSRWGLYAEDVAKVALFSGMTVVVGLVALCAMAMFMGPDRVAGITGIDAGNVPMIALALMASLVLYVVLCWLIRRPLALRTWRLRLPSFRLALAQIGLGTINFGLIAACLQQLLLAHQPVGYWDTAAVYAIANGAATASHVPGGLGVLEATIQFLMQGSAGIGAIIAFRCVYFFLPLALGFPLLLLSEHFLRRDGNRSSSAAAQASS